jgi:hypothetical protein
VPGVDREALKKEVLDVVFKDGASVLMESSGAERATVCPIGCVCVPTCALDSSLLLAVGRTDGSLRMAGGAGAVPPPTA